MSRTQLELRFSELGKDGGVGVRNGEGDVPRVVVWERVLLEVDEGLGGGGGLGGRGGGGGDRGFVVLGPLDVATGF